VTGTHVYSHENLFGIFGESHENLFENSGDSVQSYVEIFAVVKVRSPPLVAYIHAWGKCGGVVQGGEDP